MDFLLLFKTFCIESIEKSLHRCLICSQRSIYTLWSTYTQWSVKIRLPVTPVTAFLMFFRIFGHWQGRRKGEKGVTVLRGPVLIRGPATMKGKLDDIFSYRLKFEKSSILLRIFGKISRVRKNLQNFNDF